MGLVSSFKILLKIIVLLNRERAGAMPLMICLQNNSDKVLRLSHKPSPISLSGASTYDLQDSTNAANSAPSTTL